MSTQMSPGNSGQLDRRHSDRFPIEREVKYRVLSKRSGEESGEEQQIRGQHPAVVEPDSGRREQAGSDNLDEWIAG